MIAQMSIRTILSLYSISSKFEQNFGYFERNDGVLTVINNFLRYALRFFSIVLLKCMTKTKNGGSVLKNGVIKFCLRASLVKKSLFPLLNKNVPRVPNAITNMNMKYKIDKYKFSIWIALYQIYAKIKMHNIIQTNICFYFISQSLDFDANFPDFPNFDLNQIFCILLLLIISKELLLRLKQQQGNSSMMFQYLE